VLVIRTPNRLRLLPDARRLPSPGPRDRRVRQSDRLLGSARLRGARAVDLTGQGIYDPILGTTHLGILNSPDTRRLAFEFLTEHSHARVR
jgi:hypothetical protein